MADTRQPSKDLFNVTSKFCSNFRSSVTTGEKMDKT